VNRPGPAEDAASVDPLIACAVRLLRCLAVEREAILGEDPEGLVGICTAKLAEVRQLERLGAPLIASGGKPSAAVSPPSHAIPRVQSAGTARWQDLRILIGRCEEANRANGLLLDRRRQGTGGLLGALTRHRAPVYGRAGYVSAASPVRISRSA